MNSFTYRTYPVAICTAISIRSLLIGSVGYLLTKFQHIPSCTQSNPRDLMLNIFDE